MNNPILLGKAEVQFNLELIRLELEKHLQRIQKALPDSYKSVTLICRTEKPDQQIILSNKMDIKSDIKALETMIVDKDSHAS